MQNKNVPQRGEKYNKIPRWSFVFLGVAALALLLYIIAIISPSFAGAYQRTVGAFFRALLAHLTSWLPFSLAEILLILAPFAIIAVAVYAYRFRCETWRSVFTFLVSVLSAVSILFSLFVFTFSTGYHTETLDARLGMQNTEGVTAEELYQTALWLADEVNKSSNGVSYDENGFSVMPYDRKEMNDKLIAAFEPVCDEYDFVQRLDSNAKPVLLSKLMSYTHITGIYSYFTGEANINVAFPDYTLPYTAAHELSHQRGIARENEANFIAFLVTESSDDPYIRYSGQLNLFEYVANALYYADAELYKEVLGILNENVLGELRAYSAFFDTYRDAPISNLSNAVNDTHLKLHGNAAGADSYGLVVDLAIAYRKAKIQ